MTPRLQITSGRIARPVKALFYGPPGVGKSTLASQFPAPLFVDLEGGTAQLDVARVAPQVWSDLGPFLRALAAAPQGYKTLVIDGASSLDAMASDEVCRQGGKTSIEDFGYGKGWVMVTERVRSLLIDLDTVHAAGLHVVLLGHAVAARIDPPDAAAPYDQWAPKFAKQTGPLFVAWADLVGHADYWVDIEKRKNSAKGKATGGKERVLWLENSAARVAKNRYGLPEVVALDIAALAPIFSEAPPAAAAPIATPPKEEAPPVANELDFGADTAAVLDYLVNIGWLKKGQSITDLSIDQAVKVANRRASILTKARALAQ